MSTIKIKVMITAMMTIQMTMTMIKKNNDDDDKPIRDVDHTMSSSQDPSSTKEIRSMWSILIRSDDHLTK